MSDREIHLAHGFGCLLIAVACVLGGSLNCKTITEPPPNWPPGSSCAQDPSGPDCWRPPVGLVRADAGR